MDTKPLERFATWARRELLSVVDAQAAAILASGSVARTERADAIRRLESEIERHGRQHVIDKVAYSWFNRIIALRFMDARGYTNAGIVSPAKGQEHGQPEILADTKRGNLDRSVITSTHTADAILGLLDGTRHSTDAEGEAYALLLTEYCRHWHKSMPFMFEREGDYTELLVPANLLADGAILSRAREALTEVACEDVEVIGWLYQFYISERKDEVFAGFKNNEKAGADEIPAATQLFTPHWIVRYLVENSLGRLWMLNHPESRLADQMDYYVAPVENGSAVLEISGPEELTVIDPACGSGHMLTYAFDLLYAIYEEQGYAPAEIPRLILNHNLYGTEIDPRAGALAAFALAMKARARERAFFNTRAEPNIRVIEPVVFGTDELDFLITADGDRYAEEVFWKQFADADTLGSLIKPDMDQVRHAAAVLSALDDSLLHGNTLDRARQVLRQAEVLSRKYSVVTANPPYMGSKNMDARLAGFAKDNFPNSKSDLFAMFIERALEMIEPLGYMAQVTMQSWMFLSSYEELRRFLDRKTSIESLLHMDNMVMRIAFGTSATVWQIAGLSEKSGSFMFLEMNDLGDDGTPIRFPADNSRNRGADGPLAYRRNGADFASIPGAPIAYWLSDAMRSSFKKFPALSTRSRSAKGLVTADNSSFVRYWWEVRNSGIAFGCEDRETAGNTRKRWFPYAKGGEFRRWAGNLDSVVDWQDDGRRIQTNLTADGTRVRATNFNLDRIFRQGIAWTVVTSGAPSFRSVPVGSLFDAAAGMCQSQTDDIHLGVLNSSVASELLATINPTLNLHPGYLGAVPVPSAADSEACREVVRISVSSSQADWDDFETSWDFKRPSWLEDLTGQGSLSKRFGEWSENQTQTAHNQQSRETDNNRTVAEAYGLEHEVPINVPLHRVSLTRNVEFRYGPGKSAAEYEALERADLASELISYAVGCMFGRFSLDEPGLILADQGAPLQDYLTKVPSPTFAPDADNVIPLVDDGWFEDDIVERFRQFLRAAFGSECFEENLHFVEESLGVKSIRDYFITKNGKSKFYDDHVKRYKKRPIYWMFSSPKGSFNALIYMHRCNSSTVSTVLNEYLREYRAKLEVALEGAEQAAAGGSARDTKEADRLRQVLVELRDYERDVLHPLATRQLPIDLDDGVLVNYLRFGRALKDIGLEKDRRKVEGWTWPRYPLEAAQ